ncbi:hypothetical protein EDD85DRAFT_952969 [Armillaria nabsnona]|nr:hypothetical protein EDD85DRAFT_952969 [Armillaria nabsnona]
MFTPVYGHGFSSQSIYTLVPPVGERPSVLVTNTDFATTEEDLSSETVAEDLGFRDSPDRANAPVFSMQFAQDCNPTFGALDVRQVQGPRHFSKCHQFCVVDLVFVSDVFACLEELAIQRPHLAQITSPFSRWSSTSDALALATAGVYLTSRIAHGLVSAFHIFLYSSVVFAFASLLA